MWKYFGLSLLAAAFISCTGTNNKSSESAAEIPEHSTVSVTNIPGQWDIENVVENDSSYVRPSEIEKGTSSYIDFREDKTFGIMTNCNHIGGRYILSNDSIHLTEISATEMACDNMEVEEMLKKILPMVSTVDCLNDSIARLNTDKGDSYIVLKKRIITVK